MINILMYVKNEHTRENALRELPRNLIEICTVDSLADLWFSFLLTPSFFDIIVFDCDDQLSVIELEKLLNLCRDEKIFALTNMTTEKHVCRNLAKGLFAAIPQGDSVAFDEVEVMDVMPAIHGKGCVPEEYAPFHYRAVGAYTEACAA